MNIPENLLYTPEHEWIKIDGEIKNLVQLYQSTSSKELTPLDMVCESNTKIIVKYIFVSKIRIANIINIVNTITENNLSENDSLIIIILDKLNSGEQLEAYFQTKYKDTNIFCQYFKFFCHRHHLYLEIHLQ